MVEFDTGPNPDFIKLGVQYIGVEASSWRVYLNEGEDARSQLKKFGMSTADVAHVVLSHLHYDYAGGIRLIENVCFWLQRKEWGFATDTCCPQRINYVQREFNESQSRLRLIEGHQDLFGDGTVVMFPTPGHTPAHQSPDFRITHFLYSCRRCRVLVQFGWPEVRAGTSLHLERTLHA